MENGLETVFFFPLNMVIFHSYVSTRGYLKWLDPFVSKEKICAKHLPKDDDHSEVFIDCIYDVCHGGGEEDALSAAAFIAA